MLPDLLLLVPLGFIGLIRWASWTLRRVPASLYRPHRPGHREALTVVTPVYQEDPEIFAAAIESWLDNHVAEVIAVIDTTDVACQAVARRYPITVIVTNVPGKRDALRRGWEAAGTTLVALVDSDTIWADDVARRVAEPFGDPAIGAVATRQNVLNPTTVWQKLNDFYLDYRYFDEIAGQSRWGRALSCVSGRTAVYRRRLLLAVSEDFMNETFWGVPCNSGDDKRLTMLTLQLGYRTYLQQNARVWSTFPADAGGFFRQRLRWSRNTWRSDLRALREGWVFRHRWLAFTMVDKALSTFTPLIPPVLFLISLQHWWVGLGLLGWWLLSRTVKYLPHFQRRPRDLLLLPTVVGAGFALTVVKLWALVTIRQQRWLTRKVAVVGGRIMRTGDAGPAPAAAPAAVGLGRGRQVAIGLGGFAAALTVLALVQMGRGSAVPAAAAATDPATVVAFDDRGELAAPAARAQPDGDLKVAGVSFELRARPRAPWLGVIGVAYLGVAVTLEALRRSVARRHPWQGRAPAIVRDGR